MTCTEVFFGLREAAASIAEELGAQSIRCRDGSVTWLAPPDPSAGEKPRPAALGPHVYDGTTGIALFLAAWSHVEGDGASRDLALSTIAALRRKLGELARDPERAAQVRLAIGGLIGLGSFLYTFVHLARWLDEPELLREVFELTDLVTPERIARDEILDVMSGCAGTLLALLALEGQGSVANSRGETPLDLARCCGRRLLEARVAHNGGPRAWPGVDRPPLSGFAHGAAGISYALLCLYRHTGEEELRDAALEGYAFEQSLFDGAAKNWVDPRFGRLLEQSAWCHGAPGIALGRLAGLASADGPEIREELGLTLAITRGQDFSPVDHLCCGNLGQAEILLVASQALGKTELRDEAQALAARVLARAGERGGFSFPDADSSEPGFRPSLFLGVAGIGFTLLRLAHPETLPSLLLMEP